MTTQEIPRSDDRAIARGDYDVLGVEVHRKAMDEIAREMGITLVRTSGSPVVTEAKDLSCAVLDDKTELVGFSGFVGFHVSTSVLGVESVLRNYDVSDIEEGDAFIANDPHSSGAIHQGDVGVVMPYFHGGELVGWGYVNAHLLDVGGSSVSGFAPEATDSFSEALAFPGVRFVREGRLSRDWELFIANSVRVPVPVLNDIRSMIAALNAGQRRLSRVIEAHGIDTHREYCEINKTLSEQLIRARIAALPDGEYVSKEWIEYDGHGTPELYELRVTMTVDGDEMTVAFNGVGQVPCFVNGAPPSVLGNAMNGLQTVFIPDVPVNAALWRAINFDLGPAGTIVNSRPPAPVSQSHMECGMRITRLMSDVLSQAMSLSPNERLRSRAAGQPNNGISTCTLAGADRRTGAPVVIFPIAPTVGLGGPAQSVADGVDTYSGQFNIGTRMAAVEIDESTGPMVTLWRKLIASAGGAGESRGGQGMVSALAMRGIDEMSGTAFNSCAEVPPRGAGGGMPGAATDYYVLRGTDVGDHLDERRHADVGQPRRRAPGDAVQDGSFQDGRERPDHDPGRWWRRPRRSAAAFARDRGQGRRRRLHRARRGARGLRRRAERRGGRRGRNGRTAPEDPRAAPRQEAGARGLRRRRPRGRHLGRGEGRPLGLRLLRRGPRFARRQLPQRLRRTCEHGVRGDGSARPAGARPHRRPRGLRERVLLPGLWPDGSRGRQRRREGRRRRRAQADRGGTGGGGPVRDMTAGTAAASTISTGELTEPRVVRFEELVPGWNEAKNSTEPASCAG